MTLNERISTLGYGRINPKSRSSGFLRSAKGIYGSKKALRTIHAALRQSLRALPSRPTSHSNPSQLVSTYRTIPFPPPTTYYAGSFQSHSTHQSGLFPPFYRRAISVHPPIRQTVLNRTAPRLIDTPIRTLPTIHIDPIHIRHASLSYSNPLDKPVRIIPN
jgi:hypothetical protein